ncbi:MAG: hypothetical protein KBE77_06990 [Aliarcobacter sp.]|nr:hypothetical protein [Aliarcobacter sp.]
MRIYRDDKRYKEIENIKEYELTNCIAFEMAIRNKMVQKSILEYLAITNIENYKFTDIFFTNKLFVMTFNSYFNIENKKHFVTTIHEIMLKSKFFIDISTVKNINSELLNFIYESINTKYEIDDNDDFFDYEDEDYENISPPNIDNHQFNKIMGISEIGDTIYSVYEHFNHYNIFSKIKKSSVTNSITQKFSKPILTVKLDLQANVNLSNLNFNLPKKEIISYIESIYDYYQNIPLKSIANTSDPDNYQDIEPLLFWNKNTFYKTFKIKKLKPNIKIDLDNENFDLVEYFNNFKIELDNNETAKIINKINTIKNSKDWADCLFIYDYIKLSKTYKSKNEKIRFIIENLDDYYYESKFKRNAIMDRYNLMQNLIENFEYKTLIS